MTAWSHAANPASAPRADGSTMGRAAKMSLIAALYSTQNLSLAAFNYTFLVAAQKAGISLELIGTATAVGFVMLLKFLWAPLVDRFGSRRLGHYRSWLIGCHLALTLGAAALATLNPGRQFGVIMVVFGAVFAVAGTQDVAADATATRLLSPQERGLGNGFQAAGGSFAQIIGGGLLLAISGAFGWSASMLTLAAFSALPLILVLRWRENMTTSHLPAHRVSLRQISGLFRQPTVTRWAFATLPAYVLGGTISYNLIRPVLVAAGWSEGQIGVIVVFTGGIVGVTAGVAAGWVISRSGRYRALIVLGLVQLVASIATVALCLSPQSIGIAVTVAILSNAGFPALSAVAYTIAMDLTRPESAGTDFTLLTTLAQVVMVIGGGLGIALSQTLGFSTVAIGGAALAAIGLVLAAMLVRPVIARVRELNLPDMHEHQAAESAT